MGRVEPESAGEHRNQDVAAGLDDQARRHAPCLSSAGSVFCARAPKSLTMVRCPLAGSTARSMPVWHDDVLEFRSVARIVPSPATAMRDGEMIVGPWLASVKELTRVRMPVTGPRARATAGVVENENLPAPLDRDRVRAAQLLTLGRVVEVADDGPLPGRRVDPEQPTARSADRVVVDDEQLPACLVGHIHGIDAERSLGDVAEVAEDGPRSCCAVDRVECAPRVSAVVGGGEDQIA